MAEVCGTCSRYVQDEEEDEDEDERRGPRLINPCRKAKRLCNYDEQREQRRSSGKD